jgi:hypothetical protein
MPELKGVLIILCATGFGVLLSIICFFLGGWLVFKSKNAVPGEKFLGGVPEGEVFHLPETNDEEFPETPQEMLERTSSFLQSFNKQNTGGIG